MLDSIGSSAIRSLGIDVANLTSRLAVNTAIVEDLIRQALEIDQNTWQHEQIMEGEMPIGFTTTIPGEETEKLQALLSSITSLQ